jgi:hypothetical protein
MSSFHYPLPKLMMQNVNNCALRYFGYNEIYTTKYLQVTLGKNLFSNDGTFLHLAAYKDVHSPSGAWLSGKTHFTLVDGITSPTTSPVVNTPKAKTLFLGRKVYHEG